MGARGPKPNPLREQMLLALTRRSLASHDLFWRVDGQAAECTKVVHHLSRDGLVDYDEMTREWNLTSLGRRKIRAQRIAEMHDALSRG